MPRRNHRPRRYRQTPAPIVEPDTRPTNYQALADSLVGRGLASRLILGPIPARTNRRSPLKEIR